MTTYEQQVLALLAEAEAKKQMTWGAVTGRNSGKSNFLASLQSIPRAKKRNPYTDHKPWLDAQGRVKLDVGREYTAAGAFITVHMRAVDKDGAYYWVEMERVGAERFMSKPERRTAMRACADLCAVKLDKAYTLRGKL